MIFISMTQPRLKERVTFASVTSAASALLLVALFASPTASAEGGDAPYISVGTARVKKTVIAFPEIRAQGALAQGGIKTLTDTITDDLNFMDFFKFLGKDAFIEKSDQAGISLGSFKITDWSSIGADVVIKSALSSQTAGLAFELHIYEAQSGKELLNKKLLAGQNEMKLLGHTAANQIVEALTGQKGIFLTKIAMSCERGPRKEIFVMNIDGSDIKQITHHRSTAFAPAWSPDNTRLVYSLYTKNRANIKNIDLYEYNFKSNSIRMLSNRKGINSGAAYSPDGSKIALTMSFLGNPEIFVFDPANNSVTRMTKSLGFDVDPAWSPSGEHLAFVSNRTGMPMVFTMKTDGTETKRLTFAGRYNATPDWSPTGKKVTFAGYIDGVFDIFVMNSDGTNIERLTKNQGNNEDPFFSPDGNFVVFSSNRTGQKNIYAMNIDGTFVKRLTYGMGNCVAPKWSKTP